MEASGAPFVRCPIRSKKKYKHTTSTAALFRSRNFQPKTSKVSATARTRNFQPKPSKLSTATTLTSFSPTKHDLTSKPQGVRKRRVKPKHDVHNPLSLEFNEASNAYRKTVVSDAETLLHSARAGMLTRLDETKDGPRAPSTPVKRAAPRPFLAASPASNEDDDEIDADDGNDNEDSTPTLAHLCYAHNLEVVNLKVPLANEVVYYKVEPEHSPTPGKKRLGDSMEAFRRLVAAEEKTLAGLEKEWDGVQAEIDSLAKSILQSMAYETANGTAATNKDKTPAVDAAVVERLKREVIEAADEFDGRVDEMLEAEKALKRRQERFLADTIRGMGDL
ncbi:uncharacterized protein J3D65DRAFT_606222 [Phyllosticta citribraziliensis]|uniref:Uncharacterized protein n=1 Tax=Phyllosticta citribraziliensis TaxID=989973 RepID=A0ABR1LCS9_9PEZI